MARISTYDRDLVISRDDILIGTDKDNSNITRNFSVGSLVDFITLDAGGITNTNYYLSAITADQDTGIVTFTVDGADDQTLTLGTAAFSASTDFAASDISFNTTQVVSENDITAYYLNVSGNGNNGQLLASDGDGSFSWVDAANITDTNNYLTSVSRDGNVITFDMNGTVSDPTLTLGSAAFESVTSIINQLSTDLTLDDIDTSTLGDLASLDKVDANQIETNAITKLKIKDGEISESKLAVSNDPVSGYVLTSDGSDGFSWALNSASNYYLNAVTRNNETLTFSLGGGFTGTDPSFTFGSAAFATVSTTTTDRNAANVPRADHTHSMSHVTDAGDLALLDSIGTSDIDNNAITAAKLSPAVGVSGQVLALDSSLDLVWQAAGSGSANFLSLPDTPDDYGNAGQILKMNSAQNELEFVDFKVSNVNHFSTANTGTPGKVLAVDANDDGSSGYKRLQWVDTSQVGATTFTALTDTPDGIGSANQILTVNTAGTDLEYRALDADHISTGLITSTMIADATITGTDIASATITNGNIQSSTITNAELANNCITADNITNGVVGNVKLATDAITTVKIANANVTLAKLAADITLDALPNAEDTRTDWDTTNNTKIDWYVNGNNEMRLEADGDLHVDGDMIAYSSTIASDKNLKNGIQNVTNPIEKVKQLNGVTFSWARNGKQSGGVIAQDVQKVLPSLVSEVKDLKDTSSHLAVDYNGIIGLLIETVKEQQNQIDTLKAQLQA